MNQPGIGVDTARFIYAPMEIDHLIPLAEGGTDDEENLWLACPRCNNFKSDQTHGIDPDTGETIPLFNPRLQDWATHFAWSDDRTHVVGKSACGRATVVALRLNIDVAIEFRRMLVSIGWHPPHE